MRPSARGVLSDSGVLALLFENIKYREGSELLFRVNGDRSTGIRIKNTDTGKARQAITYELGATEKSVSRE